ncbi:YesL family protein [Gracilibacillus alcaliphilus]|uniref:YesL family protein n=1 Tax=Gracilibacillus alcaliphilus TaxID=1401441 RepID=UPI00195B3AD2|nr:YesL family protein [Gracilibacillus alcaliphilus]MBM7675942.1 putative membrane protein YesL [Gracilibacillus alcaliphilus]
MAALNKVLEWITKVAYLNLLWLGFSMMGLVVAGFFPATVATFAVVRKWITGHTDIPVFQQFWKQFRQGLLSANLLGYPFVLLAYILYLDFLFITIVSNQASLILTIPFLIISIMAVLTILYLFPVYVHFDMKIMDVIKTSFFMVLLNPLQTVCMALGAFAVLYGLWHFQWLFLFFSMSVLAIVLTMPALHASNKIYQKQKQIAQKASIEEK